MVITTVPKRQHGGSVTVKSFSHFPLLQYSRGENQVVEVNVLCQTFMQDAVACVSAHTCNSILYLPCTNYCNTKYNDAIPVKIYRTKQYR